MKWRIGITIVLIILVISASCTSTPSADDKNVIQDDAVTSTKTVTSTADAGPGSLREALETVQNGDTIFFDTNIFPPDFPAMISVESELPLIRAKGLIIDASNAGVILDGSEISDDWISGLRLISTQGCEIMGMQISNFSGPGISISGGAKNNIIGGDRNVGDGPFGQGNMLTSNLIGISLGTMGTTHNTVSGNLIGTEASGENDLGNLQSGVLFVGGLQGNTIGPDNIIAYNGECAISANDPYSKSNAIIGNRIFGNGDTGTCLAQQDKELPATCQDCGQGNITVIFHNANILTIDEQQPYAQAIAIQGEVIAAVGSNDEVLTLAGSETKIVDLQGLTVTPGFIDSHSHRIGFAHGWCFTSMKEASREALSLGWTGSVELSATSGQLNDMINSDAAGDLRIRVNTYLAVNDSGQVYVPENTNLWFQDYTQGQEFSPYLRVAGLKVFLDANAGQDLLWDADDLYDFTSAQQLDNWQIAYRTMSTESHTLALDAIEKTAKNTDPSQYRHRFEHSMCTTQINLDQMEELGIIASIQPDWPAVIWQHQLVKDYIANDDDIVMVAGGEEVAFRWRDYINMPDLVVAASPCNPPSCMLGEGKETLECYGYTHISPMGLIYRSVSQVGTGNVQPEEWMISRSALSVEEILPFMTINGAYGTFEENKKGSLTPGKLADLVVLSSDPLAVDTVSDPEALLRIKVIMTMVGGRVEYCADPTGESCLDPVDQPNFIAARGSWVAEDPADSFPMTLEITKNANDLIEIFWVDPAANACNGECFLGAGTGIAKDYVLELESFNLSCPWQDIDPGILPARFLYDQQNDTVTMNLEKIANGTTTSYEVVWLRE